MKSRTEYGWLLPSVLLGEGEGERPARRSTRDWIVDTALFLAACGLALASAPDIAGKPQAYVVAEQVLGALSCAALWLRRRWPVTLALVTSLLGSVFTLLGGANVVALFTVAVHRPFKIAGPVLASCLLAAIPYVHIWPDPDLGVWGTFLLLVALTMMIFAWGIVVRARRQLVFSLRARASAAAEEARQLERERIAREMHDVLAHRISILSLHAGALEYSPGAPPEQIQRAASAIRTSAHQALQDLREVIGVLRQAPEDARPERPQPTLADLPALVEESRQAGMDVALDLVEPAPSAPELSVPTSSGPAPPEALGRNAYRIVQEALTNARKHAPGAPVTVRVTGAPGEGLTVEVANPVPAAAHRRQAVSEIPGAGTGLIGLAERAKLAGGRLDHHLADEGAFVLRAWLPWS
ncbi:histidine kinase [Microtetraspora sp. NBRC 16547]|uniref:sensor histidine kinase n=1 Tax=Microtetraspora sp. NBRC 16547 TaxID=3030993 RepID=UPI0024A5F0FD|nr:histidine kinase [Microtetraspora sp. NBRC 16547]GLW99796.1 two-component sensor histidine kinase [Microtetraspora sp. NBRC 16547]